MGADGSITRRCGLAAVGGAVGDCVRQKNPGKRLAAGHGSGVMSRGAVDRIESKLASLLEATDCGTCATRVRRCPECDRPVGATPGELEAAGERLMERFEHLGRAHREGKERLVVESS